MARFKAGQRIKNVRGPSICRGAVAVFLKHDRSRYRWDVDMIVRLETNSGCVDRTGEVGQISAGEETWGYSGDWEPLTQPHEPASTEFTEALNSGDLSSWLAKERVT